MDAGGRGPGDPGRNGVGSVSNSYEPSRGNSKDRRRRKLWVLREFGDGELTTCTFCAVPLLYEDLSLDRIIPGCLGGTYAYDNVRPSCIPCACAQGADYRDLVSDATG
jgi:5-methylcytosine-specific restriction endonuclease McrA